MERIAKFEKISYEQFMHDWKDTFEDANESEILTAYTELIIPKRATKGSAGYDFYLPCDIHLKPQESIKIPTGIRVRIDGGWVLQLFPRSGLGFKFGLRLNNTVGIIDSDYYNSDNEGHMFAKMINDNHDGKEVILEKGSAFMQGIFIPFGIVEDDCVESTRNGGFGSTSK